MKKIFILTIIIITSFSSCSNNHSNISGIVTFEAITTGSSLTILNYQILNGSVEIINEELIQINANEWNKEYSISSGNIVTITGYPDQQGEILTINVYYNDSLIGSSTSQFNSVVNTTIP